jgi:hypothetical protein
VTRVILDDPARNTRVQVLWRTAEGPPVINVQAVGTNARLLDSLGFSTSATRNDNVWTVPLPPPRVAQPSDPPGFQSSGNPVLLVETGVGVGAWAADPPTVTSPLMAMVPAVLPAVPTGPLIARPTPPAGVASAVAPAPAAALPAIIQPGPSLVLSVGNPQPGDLLPRGKYVMQGLAFDRAASTGSGVDRVSVFVDNRDTGGQQVGEGVLGQPTATGFSVTADLSRLTGPHTLFVYARSSVTGREAVVSFPVSIGSR